jgi:hypothetical protein
MRFHSKKYKSKANKMNVRWMKYIKQYDDDVFHSWKMDGDHLISFCEAYVVPDFSWKDFTNPDHVVPVEDLCNFCFKSEIWDDLEARRIVRRYPKH